jgi:hemerythrin-like domain-containing protein
MTLQAKMINKIDNYVGIDKLVDFLNRFRMTVDEEDKVYFNNMIDYFSLLFEQEVPVEQHAVEYRTASLKTIDIIEKYNAQKKSETLTFLSNLINFKLEAVSNIKGLAS